MTTKTQLLKGCIVSSIAHAIMTNEYPYLSYEQSWDLKNFSIQDSAGLRATISFTDDFCVGAIRNENFIYLLNKSSIEDITKNFPKEVLIVAQNEALQYMLVSINGQAVPRATSMFWADDHTFSYQEARVPCKLNDLSLIHRLALPEEDSVSQWIEYYDMNSTSVELLKTLSKIKLQDFHKRIILSPEQVAQIPGNRITEECIESFNELNIYFS